MESKGLKLREKLKHLNSEINKQIELRKQFVQHSKEYRELLVLEVELQKEKQELMKKHPVQFN